jgi:hypothetical protein
MWLRQAGIYQMQHGLHTLGFAHQFGKILLADSRSL